MPAHNEWTLLIALCVGVTLGVGFLSWWHAEETLRRRQPSPWTNRWRLTAGILAGLLLIVVSWGRTEGGLDRYTDRVIDFTEANLPIVFFRAATEGKDYKSADQVQHEWIASHIGSFDRFVAATDLVGAQLSTMPDDWLPCDIAKLEFRAAYRQREGVGTTWVNKDESAFQDEWLRRRSAYLAAIGAVDMTAFDFRKADLSGSFAAGAKLPPFPWKGANLSPQMFEGNRYFDDKTCRLKWENVDFTSMASPMPVSAGPICEAPAWTVSTSLAQSWTAPT